VLVNAYSKDYFLLGGLFTIFHSSMFDDIAMESSFLTALEISSGFIEFKTAKWASCLAW
jgi:hypothetical protein